MIRRLMLAAVFLMLAWGAMVYFAAANESAYTAAGPVSPVNLGALVVLGVGLGCAGAAYLLFAARGAFAAPTSSAGTAVMVAAADSESEKAAAA